MFTRLANLADRRAKLVVITAVVVAPTTRRPSRTRRPHASLQPPGSTRTPDWSP
jgi:hypothetical protein